MTESRILMTGLAALIALMPLASVPVAQNSETTRYWSQWRGPHANSGILSAFDAKTGKPHYQNQRLEGLPNVFSSPVASRGRVYFTGREGRTLVIRSGPTFEVLAKNALDDGFDASPALVENEIYLRGYKHLYSIAEP